MNNHSKAFRHPEKGLTVLGQIFNISKLDDLNARIDFALASSSFSANTDGETFRNYIFQSME